MEDVVDDKFVHKYEYGLVPPLASTVAEPFAPPEQVGLVLELIVAVSKGGTVIVVVAVAVQPRESVAVTV